MNNFKSMPQGVRWNLLVGAAKRAVQAQGYEMTREPGRGLSNIWKLEKNGKTQLAAIRTTQDRWFAFPPLNGGKNWKTLDDVEIVVVAAVNSRDNPEKVEVYRFPADDVRQRFGAAYKARNAAGYVRQDNFGMWVGLDSDKRDVATAVGSGIIEQYETIAVYPIDELSSSETADGFQAEGIAADDDTPLEGPRPTTIAEVLRLARERVAELAGVRLEAVRLELTLES